MVFENGYKYIQAVAYNGARMVFGNLSPSEKLTEIKPSSKEF
jgi:hypothetical protein